MAAHVLVVEDHSALRGALRRMLEDEGYHVSAAANGREALAAIVLRRPDLIITDVEMPVMSGLELCAALAAAGERPPVVLMSGSPDAAALASAYGAAGTLIKPFAIDALLLLASRLTRRAAA
jgi:CheY-like chemotaxis protein